MLSKRRMETAIKKYNEVMYKLCLEFLTIGTRLTEEPQKKAKWTLRDLVSECQYQLDQFSEYGTSQYEALHVMEDYEGYTKEEIETKPYLVRRYKEDVMTFQCAKADMAMLRKFINTYKKDISDVEVYERHCSKWD